MAVARQAGCRRERLSLAKVRRRRPAFVLFLGIFTNFRFFFFFFVRLLFTMTEKTIKHSRQMPTGMHSTGVPRQPFNDCRCKYTHTQHTNTTLTSCFTTVGCVLACQRRRSDTSQSRRYTPPLPTLTLLTPSCVDATTVLPNVRGYAFSGSARIVRVDVSGDGGQTWHEAALQSAPGNSRRCFYFYF